MPTELDLGEYTDRAPDSEQSYVLIEEAVLAYVQGYDDAAARMARAIESFVARGDGQGEARARAKAAIVFRRLGLRERAEAEATAALAYFSRHPDPTFEATAALELGQLHEERGALDAALEVYRSALTDIGEPTRGESRDVRRLRAFLQDNAANVHAKRGEHAEAAALRRRAIRTMETDGLVHDLVIALNNLALDELRLAAVEQAGRTLARAEARLDRGRDHVAEASFERVLGQWLRARLAAPDARDVALADARDALWHAVAAYERVGDRTHALHARLLLAELELEHGSRDEADHVLRTVARRLRPDDARALSRRLDVLRFRSLLTEDGGSEAARRLAELPGVEVSVTDDAPLDPRPTAAADPADLYPFVWARIDAERALRAVEDRKAADLVRLLSSRRTHDDRLLAAAAARERRGSELEVGPEDREAFVDYYLREDRSLAFLQLPGERLECRPIDVTPAELEEAVARLRLELDGRGLRQGIDPKRPWRVDLGYLDGLARRLLPFRAALEDCDVVCVFAHGPLHHFPFHVSRGADGEPLVAHCAVVHGLSRRMLALARGDGGRAAPRPRRALVVGVPSRNEPRPELFAGDAAWLRALGLDVTALESAADATVEAVLGAFADADLVHFTCHGLFSAVQPLDSALLVSDGSCGPRRGWDLEPGEGPGRLTARRLFPQRTRAGTAVLRACSSGVTNVRLGDEQEGLLRALLHTGVACCVVARWKIDVASSRDLIRRFYAEWLRPDDPAPSRAAALRRAQLEMLEHGEPEQHRHPYHWAPFTVVGDWR